MVNKKLNFKIFCLFIGGIISGALITEITNSVKNSIPLIKMWWAVMLVIFPIIDFLVWLKTGEEIVQWVLEKLGIEFY